MQTLTISGPVGDLAVLDSGDAGAGLPAVFVHGINGAASQWGPVIERLSADRRCIAPDLRGHGASTKTGPFAAEDYLGDILAVVDELGLDRFHAIGTSFGGPVVVALAGKAGDRVASLVALGSTLAPAGLDVDAAIAGLRAVGPEAFFGQLVRQASFMPGTPEEIIEEAIGVATSGRDADLIADVSATAFASDLSTLAGSVTSPSLVLSGAYDMTCPVPQGQAMAKALGATFEVLKGRGHMAMLEDPATVADRIGAFLAEHDSDA